MSAIEIIPFFDTKEKVFNQQVYMPNFEASFRSEGYENYMIYESSLLVSIDFRNENNNFWKTFVFRAATPIRNMNIWDPSEYSKDEKDEVTFFMEYYKEMVEKNLLPGIKIKDYNPLESMLRCNIYENTCYAKNSKNIANPCTLTFTLDFGPSMHLTLKRPDPLLYTRIRYGMFFPSDNKQYFNPEIDRRYGYFVGRTLLDYEKFVFDRIKPSCDILGSPIPIDAIPSLKEGKGNGAYFRDIMLSLTDIIRLVYEFYCKEFNIHFRKLAFALYQGNFAFNNLDQSLESFAIVFKLHLIKKCLEQSNFDNAENTPVVLHDNPRSNIPKEHSCVISAYNACVCFPLASWIDKNSSKNANIIGAVGMRLLRRDILSSAAEKRHISGLIEKKSLTDHQ